MSPEAPRLFTAIIEQEGDSYVALCPELDVTSQGESVEQALANLREAVELFLETGDSGEFQHRRRGQVFVTNFRATPR